MDFTISIWIVVFWRLAIILVVSLVVALLALLIFRTAAFAGGHGRLKGPEAAVILFSISLIGALVGDLSGSSQESIAGQLVPAILTLLGALAVFIFGKKTDETGLVSLAVLSFVLSLSISYTNALLQKNDKDAFLFCRDSYANPDILASQKVLDRFNGLFRTYCDAAIGRYTKR